MSMIKKALQRARKDRHEEGHRIPVEQAASEMPGLAEKARGDTRTKAISLDHSHIEKHRIVMPSGDPKILDCYNLLRTQVLQRTRDKGYRTIMVTSAVAGEGKTVTAVNLAMSIARDVQHTVLLVDTDLRNPQIHHYLGCNATRGLSDYILDDVPLAELLVNPGIGKMVVLPAGKSLPGSTEILGSPAIKNLVLEMKNRYPDRYVIFDSPPLLGLPDSLVFSSYIDGIILVVEAGSTPKDQIRKAIQLLEGKTILGLVMNKSPEAEQDYYYY